MAQDKKAVIKELIEMGKAKGKLTTKEINDALEELDFDVEQVDKLYDTFETCNIEIIEDFAAEVVASTEKDSELENILYAEGISIDDPVCQMGDIERVFRTDLNTLFKKIHMHFSCYMKQYHMAYKTRSRC